MLLSTAPAFASDSAAELVKAWHAAAPQDRPALEAQLIKSGPEAVKPLLPEMRRRRVPVLEIFGRMGDAAVPALLKTLKDPVLGGYAREALVHATETDGARIPELLACMKDADTRGVCGMALLKAATPRAGSQVSALTKALAAKDAQTRVVVSQALSQLGGKARQAVPALEALKNDLDPEVRTAAADAVKKIKS